MANRNRIQIHQQINTMPGHRGDIFI